MKKSLHILMIIAVMALGACKKEALPELPNGNAPVYNFTGELDGEKRTFVIGDEGVIMHHGLANENGLITYYGEIESIPTDEKLKIEFIQQETPIVGGELKVVELQKIPFLVHEAATYSFDFGGVANQLNNMMLVNEDGVFELMDEIILSEFGIFTKQIKYPDFSEDQVYNFVINHGYAGGYLNGEFVSEMRGDSLFVDPVYSAGTRHEWFVDGELVGTLQNCKVQADPGIYEVKHIVYDIHDNPSVFATVVRIKGGKRLWQMALHSAPEASFETRNYGRVKVSFYKNGEWFYSENSVSNNANFFNVDSLQTVENLEETSLRLLKFDAQFSATLVNQDKTDSLVLSEMIGTFSVGLE